jgi:hypothetical protein
MQPSLLVSSTIAALAPRMHPLTLIANNSSQAAASLSSGISASGRKPSSTPALPTKMSSRPKAATVAAIARLLSSSRATSPAIAITLSPNRARNSSPRPATRSMIATRAPSST